MKLQNFTSKLKMLWVACALLIAAFEVQAQSVSGTVAGDDGAPLIGVTIRNNNTPSNGAITDAAGVFNIRASKGDVLRFSYTGYASKEVTVGTETTIAVTLSAETLLLEDVVVVGYGQTKRSDLTGAVASIKAADLTQVATPDIVQALQGRAAGVDVTSQTGAPGGGVRIRIRGVGTINNSDPLYVVDGFQTGDVSYLNPNDIQSIEVLKDASATAIYGSRGANGVVLITTKRGKTGKTEFEFSTYAGTQQVWKKMNMLNATEWSQQRLQAYQLDGIALDQEGDEYTRLKFVADGNYKGTDWQDIIFQTGNIQNYTLSMHGGSEKNRFLLSGTYFKQDGVIRNTYLNKVFLTFSNDLKLTDWLSAGLSANYMNADRVPFDVNYYSGIMTQMMAIDPITQAYDPRLENWSRADLSDASNVGRLVEEQRGYRLVDNKIVGNAYVEAALFKGLKFRSQFGVDFTLPHNKYYYPEYYVAPEEQRNLSALSESRGQSRSWVWSNYLTWDRSFGNHNLTVLAGLENQESSYSGISATAYDVPANADLQYLSSANSLDYQLSSYQGAEALSSYFGRLNYNFSNKYLLTATIRRDGSSRFTEANRWGTFPSFSMGWNLARESFMENVKFIEDLKIRGGWGQVGNQNSAGNFGYLTTVVPQQLYVFNNVAVPGAIPTTLSNTDLKWETTEMTNVGIDASLWAGRIGLTADYFIKKTKGMIVDVPIPRYVGAFSPRANAGDVENKGLELGINYRNNDQAFKYEFGLVFTKITNEVINLGGNEGIPGGSVNVAGNATFTQEGREIAYFLGYQTDGVFNSQADVDAYVNSTGKKIQPDARPGDVKYLDLDGNGTLDADDRTYLGSGTPNFTYGFTASASYKGLDLRVFMQGVSGNEIFNGFSPYFTPSLRVDNRWTPENASSEIPRATTRFGNNIPISDLFVEDGSFLRLKNLQIGYTISPRLLTKVRVQNLRFYVAGDNLLTFTKYNGFDPEIGEFYRNPLGFGVDAAAYPVARSLRIGLDMKF